MGNEANVRAKVKGAKDSGKALLETNEVLFRGTQRCVVKLDAASRATASVSGAWLKLGALELELGAAEAAKWLQKIRNPKTVLEKLGVKPGQRVRLINVSDASFQEQLEKSGALISAAAADVVFFEVRTPADLKKLPRISGEEVLWVLRPKGKDAPVGERETMSAGRAAGLVDVKVVGFSTTLSAEKYVVPLKSRK